MDIDTKTQIFNASIRLFALNGYENVSIRTIADAVGIKAASIYYHYRSKDEILDACYDFFLKHRHTSRLKKEAYEPILRNGTKLDVIHVLKYNFTQDIFENMIYALIIIYARIYSDSRAKEVYFDDIDSSMRYLIEFFECGIEVGRFHDFHIEAVALIILSSRLFCAQSVTMGPLPENSWFLSADGVFDDMMNLIPYRY